MLTFIPFYFTDTTSTLTTTMKTYYEKQLLVDAGPALVHEQFAQKKPIPAGNGKVIEFRKFNPLGKITAPLTEGVTPDAQSLAMTNIAATVAQYGGYVQTADFLTLTAYDDVIGSATKLCGDQAGQSLDTVVREVMNAGTNVQYGAGAVAYRWKLVGGESTGNHYLTVDTVRRAVRNLKHNNAPKINGEYVAIINPDAAYDLMSDEKWVNVKSYADPSGIYNGEIGKIEGVRFVESTEAKVFHAEDLTADARNLTVASISGKVITVDEVISADEATALAGRKVIIGTACYTLASATAGAAGAATITITETAGSDIADGVVVYPGEAGAKGRDVYATLFLGADAYGVTEINPGLQLFVKSANASGTSDPLEQRNTVGWKANRTAVILQNLYMVRVETASTFEAGAN